jgi:cyclopropane fatty-acyl-phospholipid synthase-like methyltransferase
MSISNKDIAQYFDRHQIIYTLFWSRRALHCGFWYEDTKNLAEAILNTDKFIVDVLAIDSSDTVLDAGCGVGGTSIHIAETTGAKVEGLTLSDVQLRIARRRANSSPAAVKPNFCKQDFTETRFQDNTFSKVFGIESICYAHRKIDFLNEAYRIMIPGGKIAVVDLFLTEETLTAQEMKIYANTIEGCAVPNLSTIAQFRESLEQAGFEVVAFYNMANHIKKSSHKLYYRALLTYPFELLKARLQVGRVNFTPIRQRAFFDTGIGTYGVFVALKT